MRRKQKNERYVTRPHHEPGYVGSRPGLHPLWREPGSTPSARRVVPLQPDGRHRDAEPRHQAAVRQPHLGPVQAVRSGHRAVQVPRPDRAAQPGDWRALGVGTSQPRLRRQGVLAEATLRSARLVLGAREPALRGELRVPHQVGRPTNMTFRENTAPGSYLGTFCALSACHIRSVSVCLR